MNQLERYIELGWRLLPCPSPDVPGRSSKAAWLPWHEASNDPQDIQRWDFYCCHKANWAVVCGPASSILVIDVDGDHEGMEQIRRTKGVPVGPKAISGGAKAGYHLYFRCPPHAHLRGKVLLRPRIEVRGHRHLVLLPPSRHPRTRWSYSWEDGRAPWEIALPEAPAWLLEAMQLPTPSVPRHVDTTSISEPYVRAAVEAEVENVRNAPEGQRNHQLNASTFSLARLIGKHLSEQQLVSVMLQAAFAAGLGEQEAMATVRSALRGRARQAA